MSATTDFVNTVSRNFVRGYAVGSENRRRKGQADVAAFDIDEYSAIPGDEEAPADGTAAPAAAEGQAMTSEAIPENSANNIAGSVNQQTGQPMDATGAERPGYAEGGDSEAVNKLVAEAESTPAIDEADPGYGESPVDRALKAQKSLPKVKVVDWEAAKRDKADAYMRAGMPEKAANIDQEFTDLKQRKYQEFATRALQVMESDPAKASALLSMASQFSADGTMSTFIPTPGGQIMEVSLDEITGKPLGEGTPFDAQNLRKNIMMNADPQKFLYQQVENSWREERAKVADEKWDKEHRQDLLKFAETLRKNGFNESLSLTELDLKRYLGESKINADKARDSGYTNKEFIRARTELHKYVSDVSNPSQFKNEFGAEYEYNIKAGISGNGMPDIMKLRSGAEAFLGFNGHNKQMSPQQAVRLYLTVSTPPAEEKARAEGRFKQDAKGNNIIRAADGKWYYIPSYDTGPSPAKLAGTQ